ncbi:MAG: GPW/gp25 family protein [Tannerella sp.]|jgi:phage baseplate assembly protein W|nr:GPW/gp25 family protein [Tannerella sp.]
MEYYRLPLLLSRLFESDAKDLPGCTEEESIDHNLELIITTCPGEHKYDYGYGCRIWDLDFESVVSVQKWEGEFVRYIAEAIGKYEPRICNVNPRVSFLDIKNEHEFSGEVSIRKRVDIKVDSIIASTKKKCCFYYSLYLGPLSSE